MAINHMAGGGLDGTNTMNSHCYDDFDRSNAIMTDVYKSNAMMADGHNGSSSVAIFQRGSPSPPMFLSPPAQTAVEEGWVELTIFFLNFELCVTIALVIFQAMIEQHETILFPQQRKPLKNMLLPNILDSVTR